MPVHETIHLRALQECILYFSPCQRVAFQAILIRYIQFLVTSQIKFVLSFLCQNSSQSFYFSPVKSQALALIWTNSQPVFAADTQVLLCTPTLVLAPLPDVNPHHFGKREPTNWPPQEWELHSFSWGCSKRNLNDDGISQYAGEVPAVCQQVCPILFAKLHQ